MTKCPSFILWSVLRRSAILNGGWPLLSEVLNTGVCLEGQKHGYYQEILRMSLSSFTLCARSHLHGWLTISKSMRAKSLRSREFDG